MKKLCNRILAAVLVAGMMLTPAYSAGIRIAGAEEGLLIAPAPAAAETYNFADGSIIPTNTDGKGTITYGNVTIKAGSENAYRWNDKDHGVEFKKGNTIEIKVNGPVTVEVGDCQYSNVTSLTMKSADGSWTQTVDAKKGCRHNDGSVVKFEYDGGATTLVLGFDNKCYIPNLKVTPAEKAVSDIVVYDFRDGSIIPTDTNGKNDVVYGDLTVRVGKENAYGYNGASHGVQFKKGNSIELKVGGPAKITVGDCQYSNMTKLTLESMDGTYSQTVDIKTGCLHNGYSVSFEYDGPATTLVMKMDSTIYIPTITVAAQVAEDNGVPADSMFLYNFTDGSVVPDSYSKEAPMTSGSVSSEDGFLTVNAKNTVYVNGKHGTVFSNGDSFDVKVAGNARVALILCTSTAAADAQWTATANKGNFAAAAQSGVTATEGGILVFDYEGVATTLSFTSKCGSTSNLHGVIVTNLPAETETPQAHGNGKIDVWDFGLEKLDETKYNNMLNAELVNSWYDASVTAGSTGVNLNTFATEDIFFYTNQLNKHRYRTNAEGVTKYDTKTKKFFLEDGTETAMNGFVYSNTGNTAEVHMGIYLYEGDILNMYLSSNNGKATYTIESPSGKLMTVDTNGASGEATRQTVYAGETGVYRIYTLNEKLVICRLERQHTDPVLVSGKVKVPAGLKDYQVVFTNTKTGGTVEATPDAKGNYEVWLNDTYDYELSLKNANGYVISSEDVVKVQGTPASDATYVVVPGDILRKIAKRFDTTTWTMARLNGITNPDLILIGQILNIPGKDGVKLQKINVKVDTVDLVTVTGKLTGLDAESLAKLTLSFTSDEVYVPEYTVTGDRISVKLEKGVTYNIEAAGINDYVLSGKTTISATKAGTQNIAFTAKPVHTVSVEASGITDAAWANAVLTFTNINEEGYVYTFKSNETIALRDGQYKVTVSGIGAANVAQKVTADVKVNGAAVKAKIPFTSLTSWDFAKLNKQSGGAGIEKFGDASYYSGLVLSGNVQENKTYLLANDGGTVKVPVKAGDVVNVSYCYSASFDINGEVEVDSKSGSTSKIETTSYTAKADGVVTLNAKKGAATGNSQTYFTSITVTTPVAYKDTVTVGANKEYKTVNDALAAIAVMDRPNNERVTVVIEPGNYEEMLVVKTPNVTLKNAAGENSSIEVINKGVDIAENAVRITSYYGHGNAYYSMGTDCKYDAQLLEANKSNGYLTFTNPGGVTTAGSYWNATVVVYADGFEAEGIIFENSFNQYISRKETMDIVVPAAGNKGGARPTTYGDTSVQNYEYKERAAAFAMVDGVKAYFNNCKFIGRQDTLYGGTGTLAAFNKCDILGSTDYIMGPMTAVFKDCNLVLNTSDHKNDVAYITASQQKSGRGYLMYNCTVTSTTPGVDTASAEVSKPGYLGRPWQGTTSEVVYVGVIIEANNGTSLILPEGWNATLGGPTVGMCEYGTIEKSGENNLDKRADWATVLTEAKLLDGTDISTWEKAVKAFFGDFNPFK